MDKDTKRFLGFILGRIYELQDQIEQGSSGQNEAVKYGLSHGFETVLDEQLGSIGEVTSVDLQIAEGILSEIWHDRDRTRNFGGFMAIESKLAQQGIEQGQAINILKYIQSSGRYDEIFSNMNHFIFNQPQGAHHDSDH